MENETPPTIFQDLRQKLRVAPLFQNVRPRAVDVVHRGGHCIRLRPLRVSLLLVDHLVPAIQPGERNQTVSAPRLNLFLSTPFPKAT